MGRKKLTLSVEERLTKRAKAIAEKRGTSVSRLVETFFTALNESAGEGDERRVREDVGESRDQPSEWATRWRGAFAEEDKTYPDDPAWDEEVLAEEIEKKHRSL